MNTLIINCQLEETVALVNKIAPKVSLSSVTAHTEINTWLPWYILFQNYQEHGLLVSRFLKKESLSQQVKTTKNNNENDKLYLYDLLVFDCTDN